MQQSNGKGEQVDSSMYQRRLAICQGCPLPTAYAACAVRGASRQGCLRHE